MALLITDTFDGVEQRLRCAIGRGVRLQAHAVFVARGLGRWRC